MYIVKYHLNFKAPVLGPICALLLLCAPAWSGDELTSTAAVDPCCSSPCHHGGVCVRRGADGYECDCTRTGYCGHNCTVPFLWTRIQLFLRPSPDVLRYVLTHFHLLWDIVNTTFLREVLMRLVLTARSNVIPGTPTYNSDYGYLSWEAYDNISYYTRILPPVPLGCPTPMGVKGKPVLPDPELLVDRLLRRRVFRPDPQGSSLMLAFFAQHFTHQFFRTDQRRGPAFTKALAHGVNPNMCLYALLDSQVDAGHIYGETLERQHHLPLHKDGKLKYQLIDGEVHLPSVAQAPVAMRYPEGMPVQAQVAVGHEAFGQLPGLILYATLWLREHNRVCDLLQAEHPTWGDEQLFQTARLVVIGETNRIVVEEYVQHLTGYRLRLKFDPTLLFNSAFQYGNRIAVEFAQLYHWHPLMPDSFLIAGDKLSYAQFVFNTSVLTHYGVEKMVDSFSRQAAGQIGGGHNVHATLTRIAVGTIRDSRQLRLRSFNEYRKHFNLAPYTSFSQLSDNPEIAGVLEELYGDIDAVEFYPGLLLERTRPGAIFSESMLEMGAPFSLKGLMGNPICSPEYWKPSTFGGRVGFDIVKGATLVRLVCLNTQTCPYVSFRVPQGQQQQQQGPTGRREL